MPTSSRKLIRLLWIVIGVLAAGFIAVTVLLVGKLNGVENSNSDLNGDVQSLRNQVREAKAAPTPEPTGLTPAVTATPTPAPTMTPTPTATSAGKSSH